MTKQHEKINKNAEVATKEKGEGWSQSIKHGPISRFYKKHNKSTENEKTSNRCDEFAEDIEIQNTEHEE